MRGAEARAVKLRYLRDFAARSYLRGGLCISTCMLKWGDKRFVF